MTTCSRRTFLGLTSGAALGLLADRVPAPRPPGRDFRIRTITAGVPMSGVDDHEALRSALAFASRARERFGGNYEVQTIRTATQPLAEYAPEWRRPETIEAIGALDRIATDAGAMFSVGPVLTGDDDEPGFGSWAADLVAATSSTSFSVFAASEERGRHPATIRAAAEAIRAISMASPGGEGNFRFCATALTPPGTPFFPAAYHRGAPSFAIGLESPGVLRSALRERGPGASPERTMIAAMNRALAPIDRTARELAAATGWRYLGIDTSPAPGLDASIGEVVETVSGAPFGAPSTLSACSTITSVLQGLATRTFGYSGLMLPVLEDRVLAERATEGRYDVSDLLLYSSVCGTGLDVVPLPGDTPAGSLAAAIGDVAALALRRSKPLSARLFPIPGRTEGEMVEFENPFLTGCRVMGLG